MTDDDSISLAVQACAALAAAGQADLIWGHHSLRDPMGRGVWMKAAGWGFEEIDASRIVLVSPSGSVLQGSGRRHIEYPIHTEILASRPDVFSVVHTHSAAANAFAALDVEFRPLDHAGALFAYPQIPRFTLTGGLIKTPALGSAVASALGSARALLLPQHGLVTVGADTPTAVMTAILLDRACQTQLTAMAAGPLRRWGSESDTLAKIPDAWSDTQIQAAWSYLLRRASARPGPGSPLPDLSPYLAICQPVRRAPNGVDAP
jgi:ribulose-5-phosphate 4-epimerase/fuculose-1-phosphate aldolase